MSKLENINDNQVIVLEQKPIISYDLVEQKGKEVRERIASLNLEAIEANEDNLKILKSTRTELKKDFDLFESQRKMVKDLVMKPYNDFDEAYKAHISSLFKDADIQLKAKVDTVDDEILTIKIDGIKAYFEEVNTFSFLAFSDLDLKIIKSITDKKLKEEIDSFLASVSSNLAMIDTLENKDRVLAKYQIHKDLNRAISEAQIEVKREQEIKAKNEADQVAQKEAEEREKQKEAEYVAEVMPQAEETKAEETKPEEKLFKSVFTVVGTRDQFAELKQFMNDKGIRYE